jgi:ferritin-like metal-binding protein YciE
MFAASRLSRRRRLSGALRAAPAGLEARETHEKNGDDSVSQSEQKVVQYLSEAHATEVGLARVLQAQIAMTPDGSFRAGLEKHLDETHRHAERVQTRLRELGTGQNAVLAGIGFTESVLNQTLALWKAPLELLRASRGDEKLLKNAKDLCSTEALEIAGYTALERIARAVGDDTTAQLAASIRADEQTMLERVLREIPKLAEAVVRGESSPDAIAADAADALVESAKRASPTGRRRGARAKATVNRARKAPAVARAQRQANAPIAAQEDLPIARYGQLTAEDIIAKLPALSQAELGKVNAHERAHDDRATVVTRIAALRGDEPWPGYDELTAEQIREALSDADGERAQAVRAYERAHKSRAGVMDAVERELATA